MKNKINKFLIIGALALGFTANALASSEGLQSDIKNKIEQNIMSSVNKEINTNNPSGLLSEKSKFEITLISEKDVKILQASGVVVADSGVVRKEGVCHINLVFKENGDMFEFTNDKETINLTKFTNPVQLEIAQKFTALHEQVHCEFSTIENPISIEGKSKSFNEKMNYLLKDQASARNNIAYIDTLNENFADVGATFLLIKEYGANNPDLKFVLNALKEQRHENYFNDQVDFDSHYTHFSLDEAMSQNNIDKFNQVKNNDDFKKLILEIANQGTQQVMVNKPNMAKVSLSKDQLDYSVLVNTVVLLGYESKSEEFRKQKDINPWKKGVGRGLAAEIAKDMIAGENLEKLAFYEKNGSPGKNYAETFTFVNDILKNKSVGFFNQRNYLQAEKQLNEFKEAIFVNQKTSSFDLIDKKMDKSEIKTKISELRKDFLQKTNTSENVAQLSLK